MAKIARAVQKIFGSGAGFHELGVFGSKAAGSLAYSTDPVVIQSLSNYLDGWFAAVIGQNSPCIEDMNALHFLYAYQLAYIMQAGIPEWNAATTYYISSFANDGAGNIYSSLVDSNTNNALSDPTKWQNISRTAVATKTANYTAVKSDALIKVSVTHNETLPDAAICSGLEYVYVKTDSNASTVTFLTQSSQTMSGLASGGYTLTEQWSFVRFRSDGTNWLIVGAG